MTQEKTFTLAQLRAAVVMWETDVRANRADFIGDDEARDLPLDECADRYVEAIAGYVEKAAPDAQRVLCPVSDVTTDRFEVSVEGWSIEERLRDEFASHALQGLIAHEGAAAVDKVSFIDTDCRRAYAYADGMMRARDAGEKVKASRASVTPWRSGVLGGLYCVERTHYDGSGASHVEWAGDVGERTLFWESISGAHACAVALNRMTGVEVQQ
jgi:hypothetical protein